MNALTEMLIPELMIRFALSNAVVALPLGLFAWWAQARANRPFLAHMLWLIVLLKLVTPPLYGLPVLAAPEPDPFAFAAGVVPPETSALEPTAGADSGAAATLQLPDWKTVIVVAWLIGSALVLAWAVVNVVRFNRLLQRHSSSVAPEWQQRAAEIARRLDLGRAPDIQVTAASITPMVWWLGGPVRIYLPRALFEQLDARDLSAILTHELAHVRRGDHLVRWLECLVCVTLWWNPIAWWARRNLRACEEICCDAFVLSKTATARHSYAGALVNAMELLAAPMIRPSGLASHVNGGFIERRIRMILSRKTLANTPLWARGLVVTGAVLVLPLGFTIAQESDGLERVEQWLETGVNSAFVTQEQADIMLTALRISEKQRIVLLESYEGANNAPRSVAAVGDPVFVRSELDAEEMAAMLEWAKRWLRARAESGQIPPTEAGAIVRDMESAVESGGFANATVLYEKTMELGLVDRETAARRSRIVTEMLEVWNVSPEHAEIEARRKSF